MVSLAVVFCWGHVEWFLLADKFKNLGIYDMKFLRQINLGLGEFRGTLKFIGMVYQ